MSQSGARIKFSVYVSYSIDVWRLFIEQHMMFHSNCTMSLLGWLAPGLPFFLLIKILIDSSTNKNCKHFLSRYVQFWCGILSHLLPYFIYTCPPLQNIEMVMDARTHLKTPHPHQNERVCLIQDSSILVIKSTTFYSLTSE